MSFYRLALGIVLSLATLDASLKSALAQLETSVAKEGF